MRIAKAIRGMRISNAQISYYDIDDTHTRAYQPSMILALTWLV